CALCAATFTLFRREHHCRLCSIRVCGTCSSKTVAVAAGGDAVR
ncbi:unnamed protein product, partial [Phaeothamnion confervicola]